MNLGSLALAFEPLALIHPTSLLAHITFWSTAKNEKVDPKSSKTQAQKVYIPKLIHRKTSQLIINSYFMLHSNRIGYQIFDSSGSQPCLHNRITENRVLNCAYARPCPRLVKSVLWKWYTGMDNFLNSQKISACCQKLRTTVLAHSSSY